jgi:hypothetical protein
MSAVFSMHLRGFPTNVAFACQYLACPMSGLEIGGDVPYGIEDLPGFPDLSVQDHLDRHMGSGRDNSAGIIDVVDAHRCNCSGVLQVSVTGSPPPFVYFQTLTNEMWKGGRVSSTIFINMDIGARGGQV